MASIEPELGKAPTFTADVSIIAGEDDLAEEGN
jgi:hypothetical protein